MSQLFTNELPEPEMSTALVEHGDPTPMMFLDRCGVDLTPEQTKAWMDLKERHEDRQAKQAFAVAMKACQDEMPIIVKDAENKKTHSRYPKLENVSKMTKPIYTKHGFTLSFHEAKADLPNHKRTVCDVRHDAGHTVEYYVELPVDGTGPKGEATSMNAVQGSVSTLSGYGQRVLKCMIFDLTIAETDNDGNSQHEFIGEEEIAMLKELIESTDTNLQRFLEWAAIDSLKEMSRDFFPAAVTQLKRKQKR